MSSSRGSILGSNVTSGEDCLHPKVNITVRDLYAIQNEFNQYANTDELIPKLIAKGLLSDSEVYMIRNPYLPPNRKIVELFQCISNKGPDAPEKIFECLTEKPIIPGHRYLASRLTGDSKQDASRKASSNFETKMNPSVSRKIDNLKLLFADLLIDTHRYFVTSGVRIEDFRIFVSFMSASRTNSSSLFFRDHLPSLSSASTIDQLFTIINENQYWNHFNYQLLEAVIRKFGDKSIRAKLEDYIDNVVTFENTVSLSEYSVNVSKDVPDKPDFTPVKTTLLSDKEWSTYSLAETRYLQMKLCDRLNIQEHALCYQDAEEGSVVIRWLIPTSIQDSVILQAQQRRQELYKIGISTLEINNVTICTTDDQSDYENMHGVKISIGLVDNMDLSSILFSLDSIEKNVQDFSTILHLHRQAIIRKLSNKPTTNTEVKSLLYDKINTDLPVMKRSFSQNTPLHIDHTRSDSLATPTLSKSRSPSPLGQSTSLPRSHQSLGNFHQTTVYSGTGYCIRDESEREDISKWIQPDSGYEDPSCWRTASS